MKSVSNVRWNLKFRKHHRTTSRVAKTFYSGIKWLPTFERSHFCPQNCDKQIFGKKNYDVVQHTIWQAKPFIPAAKPSKPQILHGLKNLFHYILPEFATSSKRETLTIETLHHRHPWCNYATFVIAKKKKQERHIKKETQKMVLKMELPPDANVLRRRF